MEGLVEKMERKAKPRTENGRKSPDTPSSTDMSTDYSSASSIEEEHVDPSVGRHLSFSLLTRQLDSTSVFSRSFLN
jgi:hypothetical protein